MTIVSWWFRSQFTHEYLEYIHMHMAQFAKHLPISLEQGIRGFVADAPGVESVSHMYGLANAVAVKRAVVMNRHVGRQKAGESMCDERRVRENDVTRKIISLFK